MSLLEQGSGPQWRRGLVSIEGTLVLSILLTGCLVQGDNYLVKGAVTGDTCLEPNVLRVRVSALEGNSLNVTYSNLLNESVSGFYTVLTVSGRQIFPKGYAWHPPHTSKILLPGESANVTWTFEANVSILPEKIEFFYSYGGADGFPTQLDCWGIRPRPDWNDCGNL